MNAVRMSHYPPDAEFLDLCDELGLYVLDELAGWHNHYDTTSARKLVEEMVTRDVNHPSILFWDNGNEGGFNTNLDRVFLEFDPQQRRVLHPWATFSGINTTHYLAYDKAEAACAGFKTYYADGKEHVATNDATRYIYMPTEFLHGLYDGGAGAGLEDYWRLMTASQHLGGGFIWVFCDDGVQAARHGRNGHRRQPGARRHRRPVSRTRRQLLHDQGTLVADPGATRVGRHVHGGESLQLYRREPVQVHLATAPAPVARRGATDECGPRPGDHCGAADSARRPGHVAHPVAGGLAGGRRAGVARGRSRRA